MREIIDNLYLFSLSKDSFGAIIAQRARHSAGAINKNIFEHLGIDLAEKRFISNCSKSIADMPCVVMGKNEKDRCAVLIDDCSSLELPVGIAMEIPIRTKALGMAYIGSEDRISPKAQSFINDADEIPYNVESEIAVSRSIRSLCNLCDVLHRDGAVSARVSDMLGAVSELVCIPIEYSYKNGPSFDTGGDLLHVNACLFVTLAMAMAAREYSPDRRLFASASVSDEFVSITLAFKCESGSWIGRGLLDTMLCEGDMICEMCERDGWMVCSMAPCYADEGLAGVKDHMDLTRLLEFFEIKSK